MQTQFNGDPLKHELCRRLLQPHHQIHRIRYFTARVKPRPGDADQHVRQDAYLRALQTLPGLEIHYGHFLSHAVRMPLAQPAPGGPWTVEVVKTEEKGPSDINDVHAVKQRVGSWQRAEL